MLGSPTRRFRLVRLTVALTAALAAPATVHAQSQEAFWNALHSMCGQAFEGRIAVAELPNVSLEGDLVIHVNRCTPNVVRMPFFVGEDRSRTWVFTRTANGLRLKHDHRHEDGTEDEVTQYGGDTADDGSATRQAFHADDFTAGLVPTASNNVWTVEVRPGEVLAYELHRGDPSEYLRLEFDLSRPVETPEEPWGPVNTVGVEDTDMLAYLERSMAIAHRKLVSLAEAVPDHTWDFRPMRGVRSFGEVFQHVAADNWFGPAVMGVPAPPETGVTDDQRTMRAYQSRDIPREQVIRELDESFDHMMRALQETSGRLGEDSTLRSGATVGDVWVRLIVHLHEHLGQTVAYARSNEIVPPWSR